MFTFGVTSIPSTTSIENNLKTLKDYVIQAKDAGCTALCFPECFLTGYYRPDAAKYAIEKTSSYLVEIQNLAQNLKIDLLVGFMEKAGDNLYITHGVFLSAGETMYYHKTHLGEREMATFTAGDSLDIFTLSCGVKFGFQLCVETHFNDITQSLSLKDAQIIFAPFAVPRVAGNREDIWKKYIPARSYDNQIYMACCNQLDAERFGGGIMVTDPTGEIIKSYFEDQPKLITFEVPEALSSRKHYFPSRRKPELYI